MNLSGIDLNLLVVFDALMRERHVTRAGEKLGLSQPATSNALARLRHLTNDELFVRTGGGLQPTPKAILLAQEIQPALQQIQIALSREREFDPTKSDRIFAIGMSDYMEFTLLPPLMEKLLAIAPNIKIQIRAGDRQKLLSLLDNGEIDLACGLFPEKIPWHEEQLLFREKYVCVCRRDRPLIGDSLCLEEYVAASHLLVSIKEDMVGRIDELLAQNNLKRHIAISVPHFLVASFILARTDLIATLALRVAQAFADFQNLKIMPLPVSIDGFSVFMRWHRSNCDNPSHIWLREIIAKVAMNV